MYTRVYQSHRHTVLQSIDGGLTWSELCNVSANPWQWDRVISVSAHTHNDTFLFWVKEFFHGSSDNFRLSVYTVNTTDAVWRTYNVTVPSNVGIQLARSELVYDGQWSVLLVDPDSKALLVWTVVSRQHVCQLVSGEQLTGTPYWIVVDRRPGQHQLSVYIGMGRVRVFRLTYEQRAANELKC